MSPLPRTAHLLAATFTAALVLTACGGEQSPGLQPAPESSGAESPSAAAPGGPADASNWDSVLAEAKGQTVDWYMYGGDDVLNKFVNGVVKDRLAALGVTLEQVRIEDTADAVDKVLGERQAGRDTDGSVDAIWLNGENFATGVQADLWRCGWAQDLPNAQYVDLASDAVRQDFGVPTDGCEAAWQQANSALVYDSAKLSKADVESVTSLFDWAKANPGRFTYPALPDFTGSMAVRTVLYDTVGGPTQIAEDNYAEAVKATVGRLQDIEPSLWRGGSTYPQSQDQVEKLYADGEISTFFTYGPGAVAAKVKDGTYPDTTREVVPSIGNISNVSFLAVPKNAADQAGALVLANVLEDPLVQLGLFKAEGAYPAIDVSKTSAAVQDKFAAVETSPSVLTLAELTKNAQPELKSDFIGRIEDDWTKDVLQK